MSSMITEFLYPSSKVVLVLILGKTVEKFVLLILILPAGFESSETPLDSSWRIKVNSGSQF